MQLKTDGKTSEALKKLKKPPSKRKQNGGRGGGRQKSEVETPVKEQLSELEKEILLIQINELEGKLKRKSHLCSYMEEEASLYRTLYGGKLFLKSESMKLLNEAFRDFASEIFLLEQEYQAMQGVHGSLAQRQHFCLAYQKRVDMLNALGTQLEENLLESEKCFDELPLFTEMFADLEEKAASKKEKYDSLREEILKNFDGCLRRKSHLCSYMEEEASLYRTLYGGKLFLKSESMKLLNEAFRDFASEIFLLEQEYQAMQGVHGSLAQRQHFCLAYQKRVDMLNALGTQLEENLLESEKCFDELPLFTEMFADLEEKAASKKEKYDSLREEILKNFDGCLRRIQNRVHLKADDLICERDLKLDLLPFSWQALFCSGWLSHSWWEDSSSHLQHLWSQNAELEEKREHLLQELQRSPVRGLMSEREKPAEPEPVTPEEPLQDSELHQLCLYLESKNMHQQNKLRSMQREMVDLERAILSLEGSGEGSFHTSYLVQVVQRAGALIKREMEGP